MLKRRKGPPLLDKEKTKGKYYSKSSLWRRNGVGNVWQHICLFPEAHTIQPIISSYRIFQMGKIQISKNHIILLTTSFLLETHFIKKKICPKTKHGSWVMCSHVLVILGRYIILIIRLRSDGLNFIIKTFVLKVKIYL